MKFKNIKLKDFLIIFIACSLYPIYKCITMDNKLLALADSTFIISLLLIVLGIFNWLYLKGDFDVHSFIARRAFLKRYDFQLDDYQAVLREKRKDRFNYPLFNGLIFLIISIIINIIY